jgi:hypothetical protein
MERSARTFRCTGSLIFTWGGGGLLEMTARVQTQIGIFSAVLIPQDETN